MQARGYTLDQVSEQLKEFGVLLATPTLRNYLKRAGGGTSPKKKSTAPEGETKE